MSISSEITINAPVAEVKKVFFDFAGHKDWNPFFTSMEVIGGGKPDVGSQLSVYMQPESGSAMTFKPTVVESTESEFAWKGVFLFEFLGAGRHYFKFTPATVEGKEVTKFQQGEDFSGLVFSLFKSIIANTEVSFKKMNAALKEKVEGSTQ